MYVPGAVVVGTVAAQLFGHNWPAFGASQFAIAHIASVLHSSVGASVVGATVVSSLESEMSSRHPYLPQFSAE
jgi:hypothetical protein